ncbi:hypothetical protein FM037_11595 [Shewanella psychropiezotolerans]|uniref:Uncharacterized protein n=2 Tax=Shewanella psychropiezotolerans TaxID=2593655 RepID=A0ABX5WXE0_9GAMM|nr:hypothetical protein FM037_11595 [Shewanella psychropiezotolerans]
MTHISRTHLFSSGLFLLLCLIYATGFYQLAQSSVVITVLITLFLPVLFWPLTRTVENHQEIKRILMLESCFNVICVLALTQSISQGATDILFVVFFILQAGGFIAVQIKKKAFHSLPSSLCLSVAIAVWIFNGNQTELLGDGNLLIFGSQVPWQLKGIYLAWLAQVILSEYRHILPKLTILLVHMASFIVAVMADDFFHARIVTASHLLFLSLCFDLKLRSWGGADFAISQRVGVMMSKANIASWVSIICLLVCLSLAIHLLSNTLIT